MAGAPAVSQPGWRCEVGLTEPEAVARFGREHVRVLEKRFPSMAYAFNKRGGKVPGAGKEFSHQNRKQSRSTDPSQNCQRWSHPSFNHVQLITALTIVRRVSLDRIRV